MKIVVKNHDPAPHPTLTASAQRILELRFLSRKPDGHLEAASDLFKRVAKVVAAEEATNRRKYWESRFLEAMQELRFLPNSPTLMNAGKPKGQLAACFVLPVPDHLRGIFNALRDAALIQQSGGGTGFSFSELRPRGANVASGHGVAAGPVEFLRVFDQMTETIRQGGVRRGANMAVLNVFHPDVDEFIRFKRDSSLGTNFNLSVAVSDEFMNQVESGDPGTTARMEQICQAAWACGDPGLLFLDRINEANPTPKLGPFAATNPCGEQPLLPYESCNLGSIRLSAYGNWGQLDWDRMKADVHMAVRFLDNVISLNRHPVLACKKAALRTRKVGLGVMGYADLLLMSGIPYGETESVRVAEKIMGFINDEAKKASAKLAKERGSFPAWWGSRWERLGYPKLRNATVTTVAPTGTISLIAGCSSGIEPVFSAVMFRNALDGQRLEEVHPLVAALIQKAGLTIPSRDLDQVTKVEQLIRKVAGNAWRPAHKVDIEKHIAVQAAFQKHSDSGVSKTVNLPAHATPKDVFHAYRLAFRSGCKGITVYRDGSRPNQVLSLGPEGGTCAVCL